MGTVNSEGDYINKNDLILMMESYENTIKLNTTLLEQQKTILSTVETILSNINDIKAKQDSLKDYINELQKIMSDSTRDINKCVGNTKITVKDEAIGAHEDHRNIIDKLNDTFHQINLKFYIAFGGMISIIITLLSILVVRG